MGEWRGIDLDAVSLSTPRLALRRFTEADVIDVYAAMQDRDMHAFLPLPDPYERSHAEEYVLGLAQRGRRDGSGFESALVERLSGRLVGAAGLRLPDERSIHAEIGYAVYPWGQGNGYATEAAHALTDWAIGHGTARVKIRAAVGNVASIKTALNAGYRYEGIERNGVLTPSGPTDGAVLSRLPGDPGEPTPRSFAALPPGGLTDGVLRLRPPVPTDAPALLAESNDPDVVAWSFFGTPSTAADALAHATRAGLDWLVGRVAPMLMVDARTDEAAGLISIRLNGPPQIGLIGYSVLPAARGRGFTARALRLITDWAFTAGGFNRLELGAKAANIASQRAARSGGFTDDGLRVGRLRNPDGSFSDEMRFAIVRS